MPDNTITTPSPAATAARSRRHRPVRIAGRWMMSFAGFPVGGYAGTLIVGPVDDLRAALIGGLIAGSILGAAQASAMGDLRPPVLQWAAATAIGLMFGLAGGAALVDYRTDLSSLIVQGAISGFAVGATQAVVLRHRVGRLAVLLWTPALAAIWALGWIVTTSAGIAVEDHIIIFGASGALVATGLTAVLPLVLHRGSARAS